MAGNLVCPAFSGLFFDIIGSRFNEFLTVQ